MLSKKAKYCELNRFRLRLNITIHMHVLGQGQQRLLVEPRVARLVKRQDTNPESGIFLDDLLRLLVGVERVHQDQGHVRVKGLVQVLDLLHSQVQKGQVIPDDDHGFGSGTAHGGAKAAVKLDHDELLQHGLDGLLGLGLLQGFIVQNLEEIHIIISGILTRCDFTRFFFIAIKRGFVR